MTSCTLIVFVRYPRPGRVKTRLVPALGPETAADLYRALAEGVLEATNPRPGDYERLVFFDPPQADEEVRRWLPAGRIRRQSDGDLGARMSDAFAKAFKRGAHKVALVGSDVPSLTRACVLEAFAALDRADLVLGPGEDGGYYLVALRAPQPLLFDGVPWGTARVMEETLGRAEAAGLSVVRLAPRRDVDTPSDLRAEWHRLEPLLRRDPELHARVARVVGTEPRQ